MHCSSIAANGQITICVAPIARHGVAVIAGLHTLPYHAVAADSRCAGVEAVIGFDVIAVIAALVIIGVHTALSRITQVICAEVPIITTEVLAADACAIFTDIAHGTKVAIVAASGHSLMSAASVRKTPVECAWIAVIAVQ